MFKLQNYLEKNFLSLNFNESRIYFEMQWVWESNPIFFQVDSYASAIY